MNNCKQKKVRRLFRLLSIFLICLFCGVFLAGCDGLTFGSTGGGSSSGGSTGSGGSSGGSGSTGGSGGTGTIKPPSTNTKPAYITDNNDAFAGAIGLYETSAVAKVFYDKYANDSDSRYIGGYVSFEDIRESQFDVLSDIIYSSLLKIYGEPTVSSSVDDDITRLGKNYKIQYSDMISNPTQLALAFGINTGAITNTNQINYANAISGGYDFNINYTIENGVDYVLTDYAYDTNNIVSTNAWKSESSFTLDNIKKALKHIYVNPISVSYNGNQVSNGGDLKSAYNSKSLNDYTTEPNMGSITSTGFSKDYLNNVKYFLAYSVIGETAYENSENSKAIIFNTDGIKKIENGFCDETVESAFENYKGYDEVINYVVDSSFNASYPTTGNITFKDYFSGANWETTLYPSVSNLEFVYYDDLSDIADSKETDYGSGYDYSKPTENIHGNARKLKQLIYIPYINTEKTSATKFSVNNILMQLQSIDSVFYLTIDYKAVFDSSTQSGTAVFETYELEDGGSDSMLVSGKLVVDDEWTDDDWVSAEMYESSDSNKFTNAKYVDGTVVGNTAKDNFTIYNTTIPSTNETMSLGRLNVYNNLFRIVNKNLEINFDKNYLILDFNYFNKKNSTEFEEVDEIPDMFINDFDLG